MRNEIFDAISDMMNNDLRFGQIMSNIFDMISQDGKDPFYIEDKEMIKYIKKYHEGD